ncbi:MAG TPA: O-antigen ligase family protein [bacterium]|nr:O-antigen ligase family protein [bacterium]
MPKIFFTAQLLFLFFLAKILFFKQIAVSWERADLFFFLFLFYNLVLGTAFSPAKYHFSLQFLNLSFFFLFYLFLKREKPVLTGPLLSGLLLLLSLLVFLGKLKALPLSPRFYSTPLPFLPSGNPHYLAALLIMLLPFSLFRLREKRYLSAALAGSAALFATSSEGALAALAAVMLFYLFSGKRKIFLGMLIFAAFLAFLVACDRESKSSFILRLHFHKIGFQILKSHPFGIGLGNLAAFYPPAQARYFSSSGTPEGSFPLTYQLHDEYFQILVESGIPGFVLFMIFMVSLYKNLSLDKEDLPPFLSVCAVLVHALFFFPLHRPDALLFFVLILAAMKRKSEKTVVFENTGLLKTGLAAVLFLSYGYYLALGLGDRIWQKGAEAFEAGRYAEAGASFRRAYLLTYNPELRFWSARCSYYLGEMAESIRIYESLKGVIPSQDLFYNLGLAYFASGRKEEARENFLASLRISPDFIQARELFEKCSS